MKLPSAIRAYDWKTARNDLVAGATVAAIAIPQAMAYALIAGVDPRFGLYSAMIVTIVASFFGSSSHLVNGPTNAISLVTFSVLLSFDARFEAYQAMFLLGLLVGTIQILIAVFKLGDLTRYISESVVLGFMAGAGTLVAIGQIGNFLGITKKSAGDHSVIVRLWETLASSGPYNLAAIGLGTGTIIVVLLLRRLVKRCKLPQFDMLGGLLLASAAAALFGWSRPDANSHSLLATVGAVPAALPEFHIPQIKFAWLHQLSGGALAIACLGLLEALAVAKSIATYTRQPLDYNRQCLAEGIANLVGGFFQSLPGSGSLTRSAINYQAGGATRMSGVFSGIIVAVAVLLLGPLARYVPKPALAGLLFITAARLIDWKRLGYALRATPSDAALILITAFSAVFVSVEESILIGTGISILIFLPRASRLRLRELIVSAEGVVRERQPEDVRSSFLLIYDFEGELFFGAAPELDRYLELIRREYQHGNFDCVVLRFRRTRNPDVVAVERLEHFLRDAGRHGVTVLLAGLQADFQKVLRNVRFHDWLPADRFFPEEDEKYSATLSAVRHAHRSHAAKNGRPGETAGERDGLYYLV